MNNAIQGGALPLQSPLIDAENNALKQSLQRYDAAATANPQPPTGSAAVKAQGAYEQAHRDLTNSVTRDVLKYYQAETGNAGATVTDMEADQHGFDEAKATVLNQYSGNDAANVKASENAIQLQADVDHAEAGASSQGRGAAALAGLNQILTDFKGQDANTIAFENAGPTVHEVLEHLQPTLKSDGPDGLDATQRGVADQDLRELLNPANHYVPVDSTSSSPEAIEVDKQASWPAETDMNKVDPQYFHGAYTGATASGEEVTVVSSTAVRHK
ncbi:hypothetical protein [Trinickia fusca]|uniref:Uncharacterized protein n=1 Tax=Trinickia fusca TaxID=2419777 RepID=A0A494XHY0_9BURK|nr:hypothetical protein [Trinickia fusca]RKP48216.1 hypothetical protein D7S89_12850 [Trinickia fusca]